MSQARYERFDLTAMAEWRTPPRDWPGAFRALHPNGIARAGVDRGFMDFVEAAAATISCLDERAIDQLLREYGQASAIATNPHLTLGHARQVLGWCLQQDADAEAVYQAVDALGSLIDRARKQGSAEQRIPRAAVDYVLKQVQADGPAPANRSRGRAMRVLARAPHVTERDLCSAADVMIRIPRYGWTTEMEAMVQHPAAGLELWRKASRLCVLRGVHSKFWASLLSFDAARSDESIMSRFRNSASADDWFAVLVRLRGGDRAESWQDLLKTRGVLAAMQFVNELEDGLDSLLNGDDGSAWQALLDCRDPVSVAGACAHITGERFRVLFRHLAQLSPRSAASLLETRREEQVLEPSDLAPLLSSPDSSIRLSAIAASGRHVPVSDTPSSTHYLQRRR